MRKQLLSTLTIVALALFNACDMTQEIAPSESPEINQFLSSSTFQRVKPSIAKYGDVDLSHIKHEVLNKDQVKISTFRIPLTKNGQHVGTIIAVDLKSKGFLPFDDTYAVNLENYSNFNQKSQTGIVEMIDLNYDNYVHSKINIVNNKITKWEGNGLSPEIRVKYAKLRKGNKSSPKTYTCDTNRNGDISFSECYSCVKQSIELDGTTSFVCDIPIGGWIGCWSVSTTFCVFLSANY